MPYVNRSLYNIHTEFALNSKSKVSFMFISSGQTSEYLE